MKNIFTLSLLLFIQIAFSQNYSYTIKFFHNDKKVKIKTLKAMAVQNNDTIELKIRRRKIIIPAITGAYQLKLSLNGTGFNYYIREQFSGIGGELALFEIDDISKLRESNAQDVYMAHGYPIVINPDQKNKKLQAGFFTGLSKNVNGNIYMQPMGGFTMPLE